MPISQNLRQLRRLIPLPLVPVIVRRRVDKMWRNPAFRASKEDQMRLLLGSTERASEVPELARGLAEQMVLRTHMRWHPKAITRQRVQGMEWLTQRDMSRGMIISFTHHHRYEGMWASLLKDGVRCKITVSPEIVKPSAGIEFRQHIRVGERGGDIVPIDGGLKALVELLQPGVVVGIAPDFPGTTPVTFLGRRVLGSTGTARLAMMTNSPVALLTHWRDSDGPYIQIGEPIEPGDYTEAIDLTQEILRRHGEAILAWPEALDAPGARFGQLPDEESKE